MKQQGKTPRLDGIVLEAIVTLLSKNMGWESMAAAVPVRYFMHDLSIESSLKFLRRTSWACKKVEQLYLQHARSGSRKIPRADE